MNSSQGYEKNPALTAASTGTSWPARIFVRRGVITIAPIVEHLKDDKETAKVTHSAQSKTTIIRW